MYTKYWNLREKPFELTPDHKFLYYSKEHEEALTRLFYTVRELKGAMLLTGECGCGKTVLSRVFLNEILGPKYEVALITNPRYTALELVEEIIYQLGGGRHENKTKVQLLRIFNDMIYSNLMSEKDTILVIDEAQTIDDGETFEELRMLLNFQKNDRFLITLILIGQPELRGKLKQLPQLKQRLMLEYHLNALDETDTMCYIDHRLRIAGARQPIFTNEAKKFIYKISRGIPRVVNGIADMALLTAYSNNRKIIDENIVSGIMNSYKQEPIWSA